MSKCHRLHIPGGIYYVVQRGNAHQPVFHTPDDYALFERLLSNALRRTGARVHAYCWMPEAIHLIVQVQQIPVGRVMQAFTSRYACCMHRLTGRSGHFFGQSYKAVLIEPDAYLLRLVRHVHHLPQRAPLSNSAATHAPTSHGAYMREAVVPWLTRRTVQRLIEASQQFSSYDDLMACAPSAEDVDLFDRCAVSGVRVLGSDEFRASLPWQQRPYKTRTTLDQVITTVTCQLGVEREHVLSRSRQGELTLARTLIAWYATERGIATLSEVARRMRRHPSTLSMAISHYRSCRPELFKLTALHDVVPIAPVTFQPSLQESSDLHPVLSLKRRRNLRQRARALLGLPERRIMPAASPQLCMGTALDDDAAIEHQDLVRMNDRR